ncbi:MAG: TIGR01620 family protein [Hyphomicrobiaceae bacterium]
MSTPESGRRPRAFRPDHPDLATPPPEPEVAMPPPPESAELPPAPLGARLKRGFGWGSMFLSAMASLALLAASVWFARFVSVAVMRQDWVGWLAVSLLGLAVLAAAVLVLKEIVGLWRLRRIRDLRRSADAAITRGDIGEARAFTRRLRAVLGQRKELAWAIARFREHETGVLTAKELLTLAEREMVSEVDKEARRAVVQSAKRVSMVTALSPAAVIAIIFVLVENLRLLRRVAGLYGGRPGLVGGLRLARLVVLHLIATGGVALTDDLLGQFLGQDLLRRLSRRLGEGIFNGALTARVGTAALDVCRPMPFVEMQPPRLRDIVSELIAREKGAKRAAPPPSAT